MKRTIVLLLCLLVQLLEAEEILNEESLLEEDQYNRISSSRELTLLLSSSPAAKLLFAQHFAFPFMEGSNPLTEDNNIAFSLTAEISPVSVNGLAEAVWTPIAFFQVVTGGRIGSGWNTNLFGKNAIGIGLNREKSDGTGRAEHSGAAFDGLLWKAQAGGVFQFDLAVFIPGDWTHVVARTYHEINYMGYTAADPGESWYYENDNGENINGFCYYGNLFVGHQLPIILNTVGLLAEAELRLYNTPNRRFWGDELPHWTFSILGNFSVTKKINAVLITQFRTVRNYKGLNWENQYYRNRSIDRGKPLHFAFYQTVLALSYRL